MAEVRDKDITKLSSCFFQENSVLYFPLLLPKYNLSKTKLIERFGDKISAFSRNGIKTKFNCLLCRPILKTKTEIHPGCITKVAEKKYFQANLHSILYQLFAQLL